MTPAEADSLADAPAAYVHIPFCAAICPYCDFAVVEGQDELSDRYVAAVVTEIGMSDPWLPLESVYFGGGTPSHLEPAMLGVILDTLATRHGIVSGAEISLEANPEDFTTGKARQLAEVGFNRVSFGAQSFDSEVLAALGRHHSPPRIATSVQAARWAGFSNISLDLIYGTPVERTTSWQKTLRQGLDLMPEHVSCYALTVERGTPLSRAVNEGAPAPDPDAQARRYEHADKTLAEAGLFRYEVSNWARPGFECKYNMTVWGQGEYEAYGNGAHGFRDGRRFRNVRRLDAYVGAIETGELPRAGEEFIAGWEAELDRMFVGLRRTVGVSKGPGTDALMESDYGSRLVQAGIVEDGTDRIRIINPLLTDAVHRSVIDLEPPIVSEESDA